MTALEKEMVLELSAEVRTELISNILPWWATHMVSPTGGFIGRIDGNGVPFPDADKGAILNARILWTFSAAYRVLGDKNWIDTALLAKRSIIDEFYDHSDGGIFWSLHSNGTPADTKKQIYALGFALYGLSEFARATGDKEALDYAIRLYRDIQAHSLEHVYGGYLEAFARDWKEISDVRLSEKDENERKTMNTHLHIIEPYTNLYRIWKDEGLKSSIQNLLNIFTDRILSPDGHLGLFFDDSWQRKDCHHSFGHDIEASWLLHESAELIGEGERMWQTVRNIGKAAAEGLLPDGSMAYEKNIVTGKIDREKHWWVQAETVVGYFNLWQYGGNISDLEKAIACWNYIKGHIIDHTEGEWLWSEREDGTPNRDDDKGGFWKCPYHNGRMCLEIIERTNSLFQ